MTGILHEEQYAIFIISRSDLLRMRNVPEQIFIENQNMLLRSISLFFSRKSCRI